MQQTPLQTAVSWMQQCPVGFAHSMVAAMKDWLSHGDVHLRAVCVATYSLLDAAELAENAHDLVAMLRDPDREVCALAIATLGQLGVHLPEHLYGAVLSTLSHPSAFVRKVSLKSLGRFRAEALRGYEPGLFERLRDPDAGVRAVAAEAFAQLGQSRETSRETLDCLATATSELLHDTESSVRTAAIVALGKMIAKDPKRLSRHVLSRIDDSSCEVRRAALLTLCRLSSSSLSQHAAVIVGKLGDADVGVRSAAAETLSRVDLTDAHAQKLLRQLCAAGSGGPSPERREGIRAPRSNRSA